MSYYYWQWQMAIILFNSNYARWPEKIDVFQEYISIRDRHPDECSKDQVVRFHYWNQYSKEIQLVSGKDVYVELEREAEWPFYIPTYIVKKGDIKTAIEYANKVIDECIKGSSIKALDILVEIYRSKDAIPMGEKPNWFDSVDQYFSEYDDPSEAQKALVNYYKKEEELGEEMMELIETLAFHHSFGDILWEYIESTNDNTITLRYLEPDEDYYNEYTIAADAIRYIHLPSGDRYLHPSRNEGIWGVSVVLDFLSGLDDNDLGHLKEFNSSFRKWAKDTGTKIDWYRIY